MPIPSDRWHGANAQPIASPKDLYEFPCNEFVAQFIGENNKLSGTIAEREAVFCQVILDGGTQILSQPAGCGAPGTWATVPLTAGTPWRRVATFDSRCCSENSGAQME